LSRIPIVWYVSCSTSARPLFLATPNDISIYKRKTVNYVRQFRQYWSPETGLVNLASDVTWLRQGSVTLARILIYGDNSAYFNNKPVALAEKTVQLVLKETRSKMLHHFSSEI
jgi:hypothetical protein